MLHDVLFIARKELQYLLRARETLMWVFVMPIIFIYFIGTITGGFASGGDRKDVLAVWAPRDAGFLTDELTLRLEERNYEIVRPDSLAAFESRSRRLTIPVGFTDSVLAGTQVTLHLARKSGGISQDYDGMRTGRAIYTMLADLIVAEETAADGPSQRPTPESFAALRAMPRALSLDVTSAGKRRHIPTGFEQTIPGIMVMFTLLVMTTSAAVLLVIERKQGLLRRLASTPISRSSVVLGKWVGKLSLGLVQVAFAMLVGTLLFRMDWGPNLPAIILVMIAYAGVVVSLGILLGSRARSEGIAVAIGVVASNVFAALGGCWWPIEITPEWMQRLQLFLPTGWAMDAMHQLISFRNSPVSVLPHVVGMVAAAAALLAASTRLFRFE